MSTVLAQWHLCDADICAESARHWRDHRGGLFARDRRIRMSRNATSVILGTLVASNIGYKSPYRLLRPADPLAKHRTDALA
jgi:hypothetical protein